MKSLKKLRLINWHYFQDETIEFGKQTLLTGKSAAGKSTIIDALQVLFIANQNQIRFNAAAHDEVKRNLLNYLKGKIGNEERAFSRNAPFSTYIVSEFRDDIKKENFIVGVVMDVFSDDQYKEEYFILANKTIDELSFFNEENYQHDVGQFKRIHSLNKQTAKFYHNKKEYQRAVLTRFGHLNDRFFSVFTKALSFEAIKSVQSFVYDYLLEKRELQLTVMKDNFNIHQQYKVQLNDLLTKKEKLIEIRETFQSYQDLQNKLMTQDYVLLQLEHQLQKENFEQRDQSHSLLLEDYTRLHQDKKYFSEKFEDAKENVFQARLALDNNHNQLEKKRLENEEVVLIKIIQESEQELSIVSRHSRSLFELITSFLDYSHSDGLTFTKEEKIKTENGLENLAVISNSFKHKQALDSQKQSYLTNSLFALSTVLKNKWEQLYRTEIDLDHQIKNQEAQVKTIESVISNLKKQIRPYPNSIETLKSRLKNSLGDHVPIFIFCEEMEIIDEHWRNATEGFLNSQRFDLLVEPIHFAKALSIYEQDKRQYKIEGVGLVDTEKEQKYLNSFKPNSLATKILAINPIIQAHVHHLLGNVVLATNEQNLRNHQTSITQTCMVYNRLVARQIPYERYAIPFIGKQAIAKQLEIKLIELKQIKDNIFKLQLQYKNALIWKEKLKDRAEQVKNYTSKLHLINEFLEHNKKLSIIKESLGLLDLNEINNLQIELETWDKIYREIDKKKSDVDEKIGNNKNEQKTIKATLHLINIQINKTAEKIENWEYEHRTLYLQEAQKQWLLLEQQEIPTQHKLSNRDRHKKSIETKLADFNIFLQDLRNDFATRFNFHSEEEITDNSAYEDQLSDIENLEIPEYQIKIESAMKKSEDEFKHHFIFQLKEAILTAKSELAILNSALKNFPFNDEQYYFTVQASNKYKQYHDAIMNPQLFEENSLFDNEDEERNEALQRLFHILISGEEGELEEFTDYRRYLDFDIRISFADGSTQFFSKLLREKSGGETQTPFYIAVLASFHQLYQAKNTIKLVIFDEAFNKMDQERISTSLRLIKRLGLQLIAAVPDEKMQHMMSEVTTTLIVSNVDHHCFVDMIERQELDEQPEQGINIFSTEQIETKQETLF